MVATAEVTPRMQDRRSRAALRCDAAARKLGGAVDVSWVGHGGKAGTAQIVFARGRDNGLASPACKIIDGATILAVEQVAVALEAAAVMARGREDA